MEILQNVASAAIREDAAAEKRSHCLMVSGGESVAELARAGGLCDDGMRRMLRMHRQREKLAAQKLDVVVDWEGFGSVSQSCF